MGNVQYQTGIVPSISELKEIYEEVGWFTYTKKPAILKKALERSLVVITAWDGDRLVGLLRGVGDGYTILYIQDIIVRPSRQRRKIGQTMLKMVFAQYKDIRQKVILTDKNQDLITFYEACGLQKADAYGTVAFVRIES